MQTWILETAAAVVGRANRERPADAVLRAELIRERRLLPDEKRTAALAVFSFYRWFGWLDRKRSLLKQVAQALDFDREFAAKPGSFSDADLKAKAVPPWIWDEAQLPMATLRTFQSEPRLWLRARPGQRATLMGKLGDCRPARCPAMPDTIEYAGASDLFKAPEFHEGAFEIQDLSSQVVSVMCAPLPGETWWDACAGEGGKTLHLSDLMQNKGLIWASDRSEWRLQRLRRRAGRARVFNYRTAAWTGSTPLPAKTLFDGILVDAPCSGVGTWHRNPHARWTTTADDARELAEVQAGMLIAAVRALKPGARLVYSACTLTRSETTGVAERFQEAAGLQVEPFAVTEPLSGVLAAQHWLWPHEHGGNGMFIAAWRKVR